MSEALFLFLTEAFKLLNTIVDRKWIRQYDNLREELRAAENAPKDKRNQALIDNLNSEIDRVFEAMTADLKMHEANKK
jgi:hypothetical protein